MKKQPLESIVFVIDDDAVPASRVFLNRWVFAFGSTARVDGLADSRVIVNDQTQSIGRRMGPS